MNRAAIMRHACVKERTQEVTAGALRGTRPVLGVDAYEDSMRRILIAAQGACAPFRAYACSSSSVSLSRSMMNLAMVSKASRMAAFLG